MRFVQTSDWQLGMTRYFLSPEAQARYTAARIDVIRRIGQVAREHACDAVLVAGDVFESNLVSPRTIARACEAMASIPCPVYVLPGNHDPLDAASVFDAPAFAGACPANVVVLRDPGVHTIAAGVDLVAAPWSTKPALVDLAGQAWSQARPAADADDGRVRILLGHGSIDALRPDADDPSAIRLAPLEAAIEEGLLHHVALGDRHSRLSVGRTGRVQYSGSPEVTAFVDDTPGDVLVVDVDAHGSHRVSPVHVGTWSLTTMRRHIDSVADIQALDDELAALDPKDRTVVRTAFVGTVTLAEQARLAAVIERHTESLAGHLTWEGHDDLAVLVDPDQLLDLGVGGFVADAVADLAHRAGAAEADTQAREARDALSLLYRLAAGVR